MAKADDTYYLPDATNAYERPGDQNRRFRRSWEIPCTAGTSTVKAYVLAANVNDKALAADVTSAVFGVNYLEATVTGRLTFNDSEGRMNAWAYSWIKLVLAGGGNDADYDDAITEEWLQG